MENSIINTLKRCSKCKEEKTRDCFVKDKNRKDGLYPQCKACRKKFDQDNKEKITVRRKIYDEKPENKKRQSNYNKKRREKPENIKREKDSHLKNNYGITIQEFEAFEKQQDERCRICKKHKSEAGRKGLHVDHNHKTGKVRGLLCTSCNQGLGRFKDNAVFLRNAADYIDEHDDEPL